jgi:hypothetical protein
MNVKKKREGFSIKTNQSILFQVNCSQTSSYEDTLPATKPAPGLYPSG